MSDDVIRLALIGSEVMAAPRLVFHVGYISDRRVIKAASNVSPFPLPLSRRPAGQDCAAELSKNGASRWRWLQRVQANGSFSACMRAFFAS